MENYEFDAVKERDRLVEALRELALQQGFSRVVLGISGGKDSSVSAALCARALRSRDRRQGSLPSPSIGRATSTWGRGCA